VRRSLLAIGIVLLSVLGVAQADVVTGGNVRISFHGWIVPKTLPRSTPAPIALHIAAKVTPIEGRRPESLRQVTVEINRHAVGTTRGIPVCPWKRIRTVSSHRALKVCGEALIGTGHFSSHIDIPESAPFPAEGRMLAFNSMRHGRPTVAAHVFGKDPVPTAEVLPMTFRPSGHGRFGPIVAVRMPKIGNDWGYVTGFDLTLKRIYRYRGQRMSLISASCPLPADIDEAPFRAARGIFEMADGSTLTRILESSCHASS
jgi:hypothetical protein